jgi:hypothetical protein
VAKDAGRGRAHDAGLGRAKGVHATYVSWVQRLTLLAPDIIEAILNGRQPAKLQLDDLLEGFRLGVGEASVLKHKGLNVLSLDCPPCYTPHYSGA